MMKKVRNSESDTITEFGGADCSPSAVRSSDNTTTMRVKLVTITRMDGASARMVMSPMSWTARWVSEVLSPKLIDTSCAKAMEGQTIAPAAIAATRIKRVRRSRPGCAVCS